MADLDIDQATEALYRSLQRGLFSAVLEEAERLRPHLSGRPALLARVLAWQAQAHIAKGEGPAARRVLREALTLAEAQGDFEGVAALKGLQSTMMASLMANRPPPLDPEQAATPLGQASASFDRGDLEGAKKFVEMAEALARQSGDQRELVLALLMRARLPGEEKDAISRAFSVADESGDFNLVTAVAKAAKAARVPLPEMMF